MGFAAIITYPNRKRGAPVTLSADCPINNVFQEVSHTSVLDILRVPRDCVVVTQQGVLYGCSLDKPGSSSVIEKRSVTSPTEGIRVGVLLTPVKTPTRLQVFYDQRIRFFDKHAFPLCHFLGESSFLINPVGLQASHAAWLHSYHLRRTQGPSGLYLCRLKE